MRGIGSMVVKGAEETHQMGRWAKGQRGKGGEMQIPDGLRLRTRCARSAKGLEELRSRVAAVTT